MSKMLSPGLIRRIARMMAADEKSVTIASVAEELGYSYHSVLSTVNSTLGLRCELELLDNRIEKYPRISEIEWIALPWLASQLRSQEPIPQFS